MSLAFHDGIHSPVSPKHRIKAVWSHVWAMPFLRNIFLVCLAVALFFPLYNGFFISPAFRDMLTMVKVEHAQRYADHMVRMLDIGGRPIDADTLGPSIKKTIEQFNIDFGIEKLNLFAPDGKVVYSTAPADIGTTNTHSYFTDIVARGEVYAKVVARGESRSEGGLLNRDVVEIYIPIVEEHAFFGAFEIYYDITRVRGGLMSLVHRTQATLVFIATLMMVVVGVILFKAGEAMLAHKHMDEALQSARDQLEKRVGERTAELLAANKELQWEILDRRHAEERLRTSEKRFRSLVDTIPHCIQEIDVKGVITFANPSHQKMYGYDESDLVGQPMWFLAADEDNRRQVEAHFKYLMEDQPMPSPWFSSDRTRSGELIQTQVDWHYRRDAQGRVEGIIAVISEITHRKQAEKALRDNLNFMNTLIDTIPNPVFYKDTQGLYLGCNLAYAQTLGLAKEEILGHRLIDLPQADQSDMAWHYHQQDLRLIRDGGVQTHEAKVRCADGIVRDYIMYKAAFEDTEGKVAGLVGIMLDISMRIEAEQRRQQLEQQLQQAQKMEALGTLAGGIAHDFNNILAAIIGYGEMARADAPKDGEIHHYLERVLEAGERARSLIKQILAFSRQGDTEPQPVQVKLIVKEVLKLLRASLPINVDIHQELLSDADIMADPVQIHQVMMNLCTNAGYAMREKGGRLTVRLEDVALEDAFIRRHADLQPGPHIKLTVADTGVGIPTQHISRIFDPFFTTKPKGEGTGMGLSVVHGIVTKLGGLVTVESKPGEGARFEIYLPVIEKTVTGADTQAGGALPTGTERILFVDDETFQTDMLTHMLSLLGYKVTAFNSSPDALAWFEGQPDAVELVITDIIMPRLSGDEMARRMLMLRPDLPIIVCTGYSENFNEAKAKAMGIRAFLLKPLVMEELSRMIRRVLDDGQPVD